MGIADCNTVAGVVRAYTAVKECYNETSILRGDGSSIWWVRILRHVTATRSSPSPR